jgi:hypothetical protein
MLLINRDSLASYQLNRVKKELNPKFDRLCRSTTEPSVNLTLLFLFLFLLNFILLLNSKDKILIKK